MFSTRPVCFAASKDYRGPLPLIFPGGGAALVLCTISRHFSTEFPAKGPCPNFKTHLLLDPTWRHLCLPQALGKPSCHAHRTSKRPVGPPSPPPLFLSCEVGVGIISPARSLLLAMFGSVTEAAAKTNCRHNLSKLTASGDFSRISADGGGRTGGEMRQMSGALCANKRRIVVSVMSDVAAAAAIFPWLFISYGRTDDCKSRRVSHPADRPSSHTTLDMEDRKKRRCRAEMECIDTKREGPHEHGHPVSQSVRSGRGRPLRENGVSIPQTALLKSAARARRVNAPRTTDRPTDGVFFLPLSPTGQASRRSWRLRELQSFFPVPVWQLQEGNKPHHTVEASSSPTRGR